MEMINIDTATASLCKEKVLQNLEVIFKDHFSRLYDDMVMQIKSSIQTQQVTLEEFVKPKLKRKKEMTDMVNELGELFIILLLYTVLGI